MTTRPLDRLSPESRAVLSLILLQSRSYADIATLLRLAEDDVRARAHAAAKNLVDSDHEPDPAVQDRIIDYVLGEQTVSERERTRSILLDDPLARDWATQLVDGLSPLAKGKLPAIPGVEVDEPNPAVDNLRAEIDQPEEPVDSHEPATANGGATTAPPAPQVIASARPPAEPRARRATPRWKLVAPLALLVVVAVIVIVALISGGGGAPRPSSGPGGAGTTQFVLAPAAAGSPAGGSATVEPGQGGLVLLLRGHGLPPNTAADMYGVWLYNSQSDARLLGFVSPPVAQAGSFTNSAALPAGAGSFHTLILTVETIQQPTSPGRILLRGALRLP